MYVAKLRIRNFKCFADSEEIALAPGINIFVGPNNLGKTAILDALTPGLVSNPHRTLLNSPHERAGVNPVSQADMEFVFDPSTAFARTLHPGAAFVMSTASPVVSDSDREQAVDRFERLVATKRGWITNVGSYQPTGFYLDEPGLMKGESDRSQLKVLLSHPTPTFEIIRGVRDQVDGLSARFAGHLAEAVHRFKAERFNVGKANYAEETLLAPDASNLPVVLDQLKNDIARQQAFNETVTRILPQVHRVTTANKGGFVINVWPNGLPTDSQRADLAIQLDNAGTGIGQVLALVYAVLFSSQPRVILIDEVHSFLHPGAVRNLLEFFIQHPEHQYVITTHSPLVLSACRPATIHKCQITNMVSTVTPVDLAVHSHVLELMQDLGANPSDAFGADRILWVEGPTEVNCIPEILRKYQPTALYGTAFLPVVATGDLLGAKKKAREVAEGIYRSLTEKTTVFPREVRFFLDRDDLTPRQTVERSCKAPIRFTSLRMFESYLLDPDAIASVLNDHEARSWDKVEATLVAETVKAQGTFPFEELHGSDILDAVFKEVAGDQLLISKPDRALRIAQWLLEHKPDFLRELSEELLSAMA